MQFKYLIPIFFVFIFSLAFAYDMKNCPYIKDTCQDSFLRANMFYKQGKYAQAEELYSKIPKNSRVLYNLGNCYFKLNKYGLALLNWRRAEKKWGICGKDELLKNISSLKNKLFGENVDKFKFFSNTKIYLISFIKSAPLLLIQIIFLSLWLFLFLYIRFLYNNGYKFLTFIMFLLIAISGIFLAMRYTFDSRKYGVVVSSQATLYSGPGESFPVLGIIPEAKEVLIKKTVDSFYKIKNKGQLGWVSFSDVQKI